MKIAVTGSSGMIGTALAGSLRGAGHEVVRLVRRPPAAAGEVRWDPGDPAGGGIAPGSLDGVTAVIHLAGAPIAGRRWTPGYRAQIAGSRAAGTRALVAALTAMPEPPKVLLSGSAIGWYGDIGGAQADESTPSGSGFLPGVVRDWEAAAGEATGAGIRVVTMRTGIVLSPGGGVLGRLVPIFRLGGGARLGPGTQVMSWVSLTDVTGIMAFLLAHEELAGPVNLTSPYPVTNAEFTSALAAALHRPALLTVPVPVLRAAVGGVSSDLLSSARVIPRRLLDAGYRFRYPRIAEALAAELR
jgi:uncharacterized protein (TIGR01777 family)